MKGPAWRRYLRFWGSDLRADADDELAFHIESRLQEFIALGMTPERARSETMRRFGDVDRVRESCREIDRLQEQDRRRFDMWDAFTQDLRYAGRALRRNPGFAIIAVLTLALGIGANTAIFSVVNGVLFRPLPYREPEALVRLFTAFRGSGEERYAMSEPEFLDYQGLTRVFESAAAFRGAGLTLTGRGEPQRLVGMSATRDLLSVLGITPMLGRDFEGDEGRPGTEPVIIFTHTTWQHRFGGDPQIVGRTLQFNGSSRRVIGVLPPGATFGALLHVHLDQRVEAVIPLYIDPDSLVGRSTNFLQGVARLRPGVTVEQAQRELDALTRRLSTDYPRNYPPSMGFGATAIGMHEEFVGDVKPALLVLLGAVGLVLLIACANVANLLLARGEARQQEIAVRLALGANRRRIVRQLLTESTVLALLGAVAGTALAWWGMQALLAVNPDTLPRSQEIRIDLVVGVVTLGTALATGILFGVAPALQAARPDVQSTLREGSRGGSESGQRHRLGRALVAGEIALAMVVVIGAALLMRSFWALRTTDPGFDPENLLVVDLGIPQSRYDVQATTVFYRQLVERMGALPGVVVAAAASDLPPVAGQANWDIEIDGRTLSPGQAAPSPSVRAVTSQYVRALSIPMARGRAIGAQDVEGSMPVAVINETAARTIWPGVDPIGQRIRFDKERPWVTIVGIQRDVRSTGLSQDPPAELYVVHEQLPAVAQSTERVMYVVLRTTGDPTLLMPAARRVVSEADPLLAIIGMESMRTVIADSMAQPRFTMVLLGVFGSVALLLAAVGIYGILSYAVKRRTREIGIRIALGGQPRHVLWLVVGQGMRLASIGLGIGIVGAYWATRALDRLLYGVSRTDPSTFIGVVVLLAAVAFVASWVPAQRALKTNPRGALVGE